MRNNLFAREGNAAARDRGPAVLPSGPAREFVAEDDLADFLARKSCAVCGGRASFGFGVWLRQGAGGRWACAEHRKAVA